MRPFFLEILEVVILFIHSFSSTKVCCCMLQVVFREAIFYGTRDNNEKMSLINWVLPYAQRYIYKLYPDKYSNLKQFGLEKLIQLQVVVVEKLFYKHSLRGCGNTSKKRFECCCLLQVRDLYLFFFLFKSYAYIFCRPSFCVLEFSFLRCSYYYRSSSCLTLMVVCNFIHLEIF